MTPTPIIATVTKGVTKLVDRLTGDRSHHPYLTAYATSVALETLGHPGRLFYGRAAWIEILKDESVSWAGHWGEQVHFWVQSEFAETVDLGLAVAYRAQSLYSPPNIWSKEIPNFLKYQPEGIAELEPTETKDQAMVRTVREETSETFFKN